MKKDFTSLYLEKTASVQQFNYYFTFFMFYNQMVDFALFCFYFTMISVCVCVYSLHTHTYKL